MPVRPFNQACSCFCCLSPSLHSLILPQHRLALLALLDQRAQLVQSEESDHADLTAQTAQPALKVLRARKALRAQKARKDRRGRPEKLQKPDMLLKEYGVTPDVPARKAPRELPA